MNASLSMLLVPIALVLSSSAHAETLVLKNGAEISGLIVETKEKNFRDPRVTIRVAGGEVAISDSMIRERRKDHSTAETLQKSEEESRAKAITANLERRERMTLAAAAFDGMRREGRDSLEARPAGFSSLAENSDARATLTIREKSVEEIGAEIEAKLELLRDFERRGLGVRTGFGEQQRLRRAILDELFPNQKTQPVVW